MFDLANLRLLHRHEDGWAEIHVSEHHDLASHDAERALLRNGQLYRCDRCQEEWTVVPGDATGEAPDR